MNIFFLFCYPMLPYVGGIQRATENLAKELKARGHKVYYLCNNSKESNVEYDFPVPQFFLDESLEKKAYIESFQNLLKEKKIDVVINQEPEVGDLLELLEFVPEGIKKISCLHTQPFLSQGNTANIIKYYKPQGLKAQIYRIICWLFPAYHAHNTLTHDRKMFEKALAVSDLFCLESKQYITRMLRYMPDIDVSKLVAVSNANSFTALSLSCKNKEKIVLWAGRQTNTPKNVPLFIDFWLLFQERNPDWKAIVIGVGPDLEYNKKYALRKKAINVEFLGHVEDINIYYQKAAFFVMTSVYEGFPMVLLEAMNNGCIPCAFDTFESLHDIVDDGKDGIVVPKYDCRLLVSRMENLLASPSAMSATQSAAIEKIKNFTVEKIVDKWETILNTL